VVGEANYFPGLGLITGFVLLFVIGLAVNAFLVRRVLGFGEELLLRVPVVKTVYSAIRDMTRLVNTEKKKGDLDRVVTLDNDEAAIRAWNWNRKNAEVYLARKPDLYDE